MSANNLSNTQFEQLDMFKTARELRGMRLSDVEAEIGNRGGGSPYEQTANSIMAQKLSHAKQTGLYDSVKTEGVNEPVNVAGKRVTDGHHRIAAAMSVNPSMLIPVKHDRFVI